MHIRRQPPGNLLQVFGHAGARPIKVRAIFEDDKDVGVAEHGLGAYGLNVRSGEQSRDKGISDLVFDDIGRLTRPFRVDDDLHIADVGKRVQGNMAKAPHARYHQQMQPR